MGNRAIQPLEIFSELYVGDYFADTLEFTVAEHNALRIILMDLWLTGSLPASDVDFARMVGVCRAECGDLQQVLNPLLTAAGAKIEEWKKAIKLFDGKRLPPEYWRVARAVILERDGYECVYCGSEDRLHVDHRLAVSRGGSNSFDNLVTCCGPCNWSKGAKLAEDWNHPPGKVLSHGGGD